MTGEIFPNPGQEALGLAGGEIHHDCPFEREDRARAIEMTFPVVGFDFGNLTRLRRSVKLPVFLRIAMPAPGTSVRRLIALS
jgi:hypothetical protein